MQKKKTKKRTMGEDSISKFLICNKAIDQWTETILHSTFNPGKKSKTMKKAKQNHERNVVLSKYISFSGTNMGIIMYML